MRGVRGSFGGRGLAVGGRLLGRADAPLPAVVAMTAGLPGPIAEVAEDLLLPAAGAHREADHAVELLVLGGLALLERIEVDLQLLEGQIAADHVNGPAAERGHVGEHLQLVQLAQGVGHGAVVQLRAVREAFGAEVHQLVPPRAHELLDRPEHAPADLGLAGQQVDQRRQVAVQAQGRHVLRGDQTLQDAGPFEQLLAGAHAVGADVESEPLLDVLLGQLDGVRLDAPQKLVDRGDVLAAGVGALDEELLHVAVGGVEQKQAARGPAVAARPARLLVVGLEAAGQVVVDHEADVGLVDPHAEGGGGHDDLRPALHERLLGRAAVVGEHPGVVGGGAPARLGGDRLGHFLRSLSGRGVNDPAAGCLAEKLDQHVDLLAIASRGPDLVEEVGPGEPGDEDPRPIQVELLDDVAAHGVGGRGRQRDRGRLAQHPAEVSEAGVVGPEVVPPLADAVGLVDRQQLQPHRPDRLQEAAAAKAFGHDVDQLVLACRHPVQARAQLGHRERAVDQRHRQPQGLELIDLVLHQGDQRRDHQRQAIEHQGGQLVAKALAAAGGHHAQTVLAGQNGRDDLFLPGAERTKPEPRQVRFQVRARQIGHRPARHCGERRKFR